MHVVFLRDRLFTPPGLRITIDYREGMELTVKRDWAQALIKSGDARAIRAPRRGE